MTSERSALVRERLRRSLPPPRERWYGLHVHAGHGALPSRREALYWRRACTHADGSLTAARLCSALEERRALPRELYEAWRSWSRRWRHWEDDYGDWVFDQRGNREARRSRAKRARSAARKKARR